MKYRSDIDGLRTVSVFAVIAFHAGLDLFSGGYVGVDVFFVISGYLITTLIYKEAQEGSFSFLKFYKRRAARLLPALSITLVGVFLFGFVFYNNSVFDNLGKELFFSSFGAANILFAQGVNYFAKDEAYQPLIHLWSLGVEEQFYLFWPIILLLAYKVSSKAVTITAVILFILSLSLSVYAVSIELTKGYFLLHYRAFELLVGVIIALLMFERRVDVKESTANLLVILGLALIVAPIFVLDASSSFPGLNALFPCIGAALIIYFPSNGWVYKLLSSKAFVFFGLISYPLYLYHQPLISFSYFLDLNLSPIELFFYVSLVASLLAWLTYRFIEIPIRKMASQNSLGSTAVLGILVSTIPLFSTLGLVVAKTNGLEQRFQLLNPFALEVSQEHATTFHVNFKRGFNVDNNTPKKVLYVGDSVLQHYVVPMNAALNIRNDEVDTITRGGCVLLKGVGFNDRYSDIPCDDLREQVYSLDKHYDLIVFSQEWGSYSAAVTNFDSGAEGIEKWNKFITPTVEHFLSMADKVIIIGAHPRVEGTYAIQPSLALDKELLAEALTKIKVTNKSDLADSVEFFNNINQPEKVVAINPYTTFCNKDCVTNDGQWSYFSDDRHLSKAATEFVASSIKRQF
ncbi:hypothetical protein BBM40_06740 [Vibrio parahaemolyticus]|uniref:acyltransferase family protein n=1 Tax=Vibrio parahaemolyticus TaxID=670 RepID=UPI00084BAE61|nr:acyltransferase family protein [Vibrio parahaemolyticus]ODZ53341.1 hypothetical protein BBM40_06740 [Vibrio parahaemolyticus]HCG7966956.1 acyltransferase [Vibrio parahaemolyticus]